MAIDALGSRVTLFIAAVGYTMCTVGFAYIDSWPWRLALWSVNGVFAQGWAWPAVVGMCGNWLPMEYLMIFMSYVSLTPHVGDALVRLVLGFFMPYYTWKHIFYACAATAGVVALPVVLFVKSAPQEDHETSFQLSRIMEEKQPLVDRLKAMAKRKGLWALCLTSGCLTGIANLFTSYSVSLLAHSHCYDVFYHHKKHGGHESFADCVADPGTNALLSRASAVYPLMGVVSVVAFVQLASRLPRTGRAFLLMGFQTACAVVLTLMVIFWKNMSYWYIVVALAALGLTILGPARMTTDQFAIEAGGRKLKGTAMLLVGVMDNLCMVLTFVVKGYLGPRWQAMLAFCVLTMLLSIYATHLLERALDLKTSSKRKRNRSLQKKRQRFSARMAGPPSAFAGRSRLFSPTLRRITEVDESSSQGKSSRKTVSAKPDVDEPEDGGEGSGDVAVPVPVPVPVPAATATAQQRRERDEKEAEWDVVREQLWATAGPRVAGSPPPSVAGSHRSSVSNKPSDISGSPDTSQRRVAPADELSHTAAAAAGEESRSLTVGDDGSIGGPGAEGEGEGELEGEGETEGEEGDDFFEESAADADAEGFMEAEVDADQRYDGESPEEREMRMISLHRRTMYHMSLHDPIV